MGDGFRMDYGANTLWYPTSAVKKYNRHDVIEKAVEYYEKSPDARGAEEDLKTRKDALYSPNGMSQDRNMRLVGEIPVFIWLLVIQLTDDQNFWNDENSRNQRLFFEMYPAFKTKEGGKGSRA